MFKIRIKFVDYKAETKYMNEIKTRGYDHSGGQFILLFSCGFLLSNYYVYLKK
jgi:hypothetical protein